MWVQEDIDVSWKSTFTNQSKVQSCRGKRRLAHRANEAERRWRVTAAAPPHRRLHRWCNQINSNHVYSIFIFLLHPPGGSTGGLIRSSWGADTKGKNLKLYSQQKAAAATEAPGVDKQEMHLKPSVLVFLHKTKDRQQANVLPQWFRIEQTWIRLQLTSIPAVNYSVFSTKSRFFLSAPLWTIQLLQTLICVGEVFLGAL